MDFRGILDGFLGGGMLSEMRGDSRTVSGDSLRFLGRSSWDS